MQVKPYFHHLASLLMLALIIFVGVEIRNSLVEHTFIGADASQVATIRVTGEADDELVPDIATVRVGVSATQPSAAEVEQDIAQRMNSMLITIRQDLGIDDSDVQTQSFSVHPKTRWDSSLNRSVQDGFRGSQHVALTIRNVEQVGTAIDQLIAAGADSVDGLQFAVEDQDAAKSKLRKQAIDDAWKNAEALANDLGVEIVRLIGFDEPGYATADFEHAEVFALSAEEARGSANPPKIAPGSQDVYSQVELTFEIR